LLKAEWFTILQEIWRRRLKWWTVQKDCRGAPACNQYSGWWFLTNAGVERAKLTSSKTWINGEYYRNTVLARYVLNDEWFKIGAQYWGKF
jgi:hypothetical protein